MSDLRRLSAPARLRGAATSRGGRANVRGCAGNRGGVQSRGGNVRGGGQVVNRNVSNTSRGRETRSTRGRGGRLAAAAAPTGADAQRPRDGRVEDEAEGGNERLPLEEDGGRRIGEIEPNDLPHHPHADPVDAPAHVQNHDRGRLEGPAQQHPEQGGQGAAGHIIPGHVENRYFDNQVGYAGWAAGPGYRGWYGGCHRHYAAYHQEESESDDEVNPGPHMVFDRHDFRDQLPEQPVPVHWAGRGLNNAIHFNQSRQFPLPPPRQQAQFFFAAPVLQQQPQQGYVGHHQHMPPPPPQLQAGQVGGPFDPAAVQQRHQELLPPPPPQVQTGQQQQAPGHFDVQAAAASINVAALQQQHGGLPPPPPPPQVQAGQQQQAPGHFAVQAAAAPINAAVIQQQQQQQLPQPPLQADQQQQTGGQMNSPAIEQYYHQPSNLALPNNFGGQQASTNDNGAYRSGYEHDKQGRNVKRGRGGRLAVRGTGKTKGLNNIIDKKIKKETEKRFGSKIVTPNQQQPSPWTQQPVHWLHQQPQFSPSPQQQHSTTMYQNQFWPQASGQAGPSVYPQTSAWTQPPPCPYPSTPVQPQSTVPSGPLLYPNYNGYPGYPSYPRY